MLPSDPARAKLYIMWKRALAEREELLKQARRRKHELMKDLKARHESQVVLLELERRAAVETLRESVRTEQEREERHRVELAAVEESIQHAEAAMDKYVAVGGRVWVQRRRRRPSFTPSTSRHRLPARFRKEFEQLRVAMLLDRMAKNVQVAGLLAKRQQLTAQAQAFQATIEAAKLEAAESAKRYRACRTCNCLPAAHVFSPQWAYAGSGTRNCKPSRRLGKLGCGRRRRTLKPRCPRCGIR